MVWLALGSHLVGLRYGKWTQVFGGIGSYALGVLIIVAAYLVYQRRGSATPMQMVPEWNWATVNFWSQIAYALTGLELAPMLGSEIRNAGAGVAEIRVDQRVRRGWILRRGDGGVIGDPTLRPESILCMDWLKGESLPV